MHDLHKSSQVDITGLTKVIGLVLNVDSVGKESVCI